MPTEAYTPVSGIHAPSLIGAPVEAVEPPPPLLLAPLLLDELHADTASKATQAIPTILREDFMSAPLSTEFSLSLPTIPSAGRSNKMQFQGWRLNLLV
jgi:hypothetical protein